jgi:hypothetical protein
MSETPLEPVEGIPDRTPQEPVEGIPDRTPQEPVEGVPDDLVDDVDPEMFVTEWRYEQPPDIDRGFSGPGI